MIIIQSNYFYSSDDLKNNWKILKQIKIYNNYNLSKERIKTSIKKVRWYCVLWVSRWWGYRITIYF